MLQLFIKNNSLAEIKKYIKVMDKNIKENTFNENILKTFDKLYDDFWIEQKVKIYKKNKKYQFFYKFIDLKNTLHKCNIFLYEISDLICCYTYNSNFIVKNESHSGINEIYHEDIIMKISNIGIGIYDIYNHHSIADIFIREIKNNAINYHRSKIFADKKKNIIYLYIFGDPKKCFIIYDIKKCSYEFIDLKTQNLARYFYSKTNIVLIISVDIENSIMYIFGRDDFNYYLLECQINDTITPLIETTLPFNDLEGDCKYILNNKNIVFVKFSANIFNIVILNKENKIVCETYTINFNTFSYHLIDFIAEKINLNNKQELAHTIKNDIKCFSLINFDKETYLYILYVISEINDNIFLIYNFKTKKWDCVRIYNKNEVMERIYRLNYNSYLNAYLVLHHTNHIKIYVLEHLLC
jgi:hypothetical protein